MSSNDSPPTPPAEPADSTPTVELTGPGSTPAPGPTPASGTGRPAGQAAASGAAGTDPGAEQAGPAEQAGLLPARRRAGGAGCLATVIVLAALLVAASGAVLVVGLTAVRDAVAAVNPFDDPVVGETTVDRSGEPVLLAIEDLGEYRAASAYYELVIDVERDVRPLPSFLAGERVLFVAAGSVDATVDFGDLEGAAVTVDEERAAARLVLPPPELSEPVLDLDRSYVYSRDRGLADRLTGLVREPSNDERELYLLAEDRFAAAATSNDELVTRAESNTRDMLTGLLGSLGFTDVTVQFAAGNDGPAGERPATTPTTDIPVTGEG